LGTSRNAVTDFVNCGPAEQSIDFWVVAWDSSSISNCVNSTLLSKNNLIGQYTNYSIPSIISHGCVEEISHSFTEVQIIYGKSGAEVFSGGFVREWMDEKKEIEMGT
jgi:hypothetical protein